MRGNPWALAILILAGVTFFGVKYNFEIPPWFTSKTESTTAIVVDNKDVLARNGTSRYQQQIEYAFLAENKIFLSKKKISSIHGFRPIGSKLKIKYQVNKPEVNIIEGFYKPIHFEMQRRYFWTDHEYRYDKLILENKILKLEKFENQGKMISRDYFQAQVKNNRLIAFDLFNPEITQMEFIIEKDHLIEVKTNKKYKKSLTHKGHTYPLNQENN